MNYILIIVCSPAIIKYTITLIGAIEWFYEWEKSKGKDIPFSSVYIIDRHNLDNPRLIDFPHW